MSSTSSIIQPLVCPCAHPNSHHPHPFCAHREAYILGKAEFLLDTLSDFGPVPSGIREHILSQKNDFQLRRWFRLARQVRSLDEFINRM